MKVYAPIFQRSWEIRELESDHLKPLGTSGKLFTIGGHGTIYHSDQLYQTKAAAEDWINKIFVPESLMYRP